MTVTAMVIEPAPGQGQLLGERRSLPEILNSTDTRPKSDAREGQLAGIDSVGAWLGYARQAEL
jgi:hypothetical protein